LIYLVKARACAGDLPSPNPNSDFQFNDPEAAIRQVPERSRSAIRIADPDFQTGAHPEEDRHKLLDRCTSENTAATADRDYTLAENISW
jgi:hypothetical protein